MINKKIQLSQSFPVNGNFIPGRISLYLKTYSSDGLPKKNNISSDISLCATNFASKISNSENSCLIFDNTFAGYTGSGYMRYINPFSRTDGLIYPLTGVIQGTFYIWVRYCKVDSNIQISFYNGEQQLSSIVDTSSPTGDWIWDKIQVESLDTQDMYIAISGLGLGEFLIDKIIVTYSNLIDPQIVDIDFTQPFYTTVHFKMYTQNLGFPNLQIPIYQSKSTLQHIHSSGWYNFSTKTWDSSTVLFSDPFYSCVLTSSGNSSRKFVLWQVSNTSKSDGSISSVKH